MDYEIRELELPDGELILARVGVVRPEEFTDGDEPAGPFQDVGARDRLAGWARQLDRLITGVAGAVHQAALRTAPHEVSATFGVELVAKPGKAVAAVIADAETKATISVTLTWRPGENRQSRSDRTNTVPAQPPQATP